MSDGERRGDERLPVIWKGYLEDNDDNQYPCEVRDISTAGTLITCDQSFALDTELLLVIEDLGDFAGEVKWVGTGQIGLLLMAGPDLLLKKFAEPSGASISDHPDPPQDLVS